MSYNIRATLYALLYSDTEASTHGLAYKLAFHHHVIDQAPAGPVSSNNVQTGAGECRDRVERAVTPQFYPDFIAQAGLSRRP